MSQRDRFNAVVEMLDLAALDKLEKDAQEWAASRGVDAGPAWAPWDAAPKYADKVAGSSPGYGHHLYYDWLDTWDTALEEAWSAFLEMAVEYATGDRRAQG